MSEALEFDPRAIYQTMVRLGEEWVEKNAAAALLEETLDSVLAKGMLELRATVTSADQRKMLAKDTATYRTHVTAMVDARREANIAKVRYDSYRVLADNLRSEFATRREEIRRLSMGGT